MGRLSFIPEAGQLLITLFVNCTSVPVSFIGGLSEPVKWPPFDNILSNISVSLFCVCLESKKENGKLMETT